MKITRGSTFAHLTTTKLGVISGGDQIPPGQFRGGDQIPPGQFR